MRIIEIVDGSKKEAQEYNSIKDDVPIALLIHASWCGHCIAFVPVWNSIMKKMKDIDFNGVIASIEEKAIPLITTRESDVKDVNGFPTIKFIKNGKIKEFSDERNEENVIKGIKSFMSIQKGGKRNRTRKSRRNHRRYMRGGCGCMGGGSRRCNKAGCSICGGTRKKRTRKYHSQIGCGSRRRRRY